MRMPISSETRAALELLKDVQQKVRTTENLRSNQQINADLTTKLNKNLRSLDFMKRPVQHLRPTWSCQARLLSDTHRQCNAPLYHSTSVTSMGAS